MITPKLENIFFIIFFLDLTSLPERSIVKPNLSGVKTPGCEFPVNKSNIVSGRFSSGPPAADSLRHTGGGNAGAANTVTSTGTAEQNRHPIVDFTGTSCYTVLLSKLDDFEPY